MNRSGKRFKVKHYKQMEVSMMLTKLNDNWGLLHPWRPAGGLQKELFNLFEDFNTNVNRYRADYPRLSLEDKREEIVVKISLPGYSAKNIEVEVVSDFLTIRAERTLPELKQDEKFLHQERSFGKVEESVRLPGKVKTAKVNAKFVNGILEITLPKEEIEKPRTIKVG
jgi:HSP20 family protein